MPAKSDSLGYRPIGGRMEPSANQGFHGNANRGCVSHQWIYSLIWDDKKHGGELWKRLRLPRQRRYQRQSAKYVGLGKTHTGGIEQHPAEVEERRHIGHWESDMVLKGHKESGLLTMGLYVAIDRATRWMYWEINSSQSSKDAQAFMTRVEEKAPFKMQKVLTDYVKSFTDRFTRVNDKRVAIISSQVPHKKGVEHCLIKPGRSQPNGMMERFNGRISDVLAPRRYESGVDLRQTLKRYNWLCNHHIPRWRCTINHQFQRCNNGK